MFEAELAPGEPAALLVGDTGPLGRVLRQLNLSEQEFADALAVFSETVAAPLLGFSLRLRRRGHEQLAQGWLGPGLVIVLTDAAGSQPPHVMVGTAKELPRVVAELVDLGPRPFGPEKPAIVTHYEPLDAFAGVGCEPDTLHALHEAFADVYAAADLSALYDGEALRWTYALWSAADRDDPQVRVDVIDGRDRGLWLISEGPDDATVWVTPTTSTAIWVLLSGAIDGAVPEESSGQAWSPHLAAAS